MRDDRWSEIRGPIPHVEFRPVSKNETSGSLLLMMEGQIMALLDIDAKFPEASLKDIDDRPLEFPSVLKQAPASIVFFYRGQW